jgi:hypothetical protein
LPTEGRALSFGLSGGDAGSGQPRQRREEAARSVQGPSGPGAATEQAPRRTVLSLLDLAV